ncbi:hypothetical protein VNI00_017621 [Paramarasmius palmivorus]|uniref:Uncharacterized protein n=1 Tax=Paramarasmius palmivorus TaxID=297713 RepID=A0AAW0B3V9_9AGAR
MSEPSNKVNPAWKVVIDDNREWIPCPCPKCPSGTLRPIKECVRGQEAHIGNFFALCQVQHADGTYCQEWLWKYLLEKTPSPVATRTRQRSNNPDPTASSTTIRDPAKRPNIAVACPGCGRRGNAHCTHISCLQCCQKAVGSGAATCCVASHRVPSHILNPSLIPPTSITSTVPTSIPARTPLNNVENSTEHPSTTSAIPSPSFFNLVPEDAVVGSRHDAESVRKAQRDKEKAAKEASAALQSTVFAYVFDPNVEEPSISQLQGCTTADSVTLSIEVLERLRVDVNDFSIYHPAIRQWVLGGIGDVIDVGPGSVRVRDRPALLVCRGSNTRNLKGLDNILQTPQTSLLSPEQSLANRRRGLVHDLQRRYTSQQPSISPPPYASQQKPHTPKREYLRSSTSPPSPTDGHKRAKPAVTADKENEHKNGPSIYQVMGITPAPTDSATSQQDKKGKCRAVPLLTSSPIIISDDSDSTPVPTSSTQISLHSSGGSPIQRFALSSAPSTSMSKIAIEPTDSSSTNLPSLQPSGSARAPVNHMVAPGVRDDYDDDRGTLDIAAIRPDVPLLPINAKNPWVEPTPGVSKWPGDWPVQDIVIGFYKMKLARRKRGENAVRDTWESEFPGVPWRSETVYGHRRRWIAAQQRFRDNFYQGAHNDATKLWKYFMREAPDPYQAIRRQKRQEKSAREQAEREAAARSSSVCVEGLSDYSDDSTASMKAQRREYRALKRQLKKKGQA